MPPAGVGVPLLARVRVSSLGSQPIFLHRLFYHSYLQFYYFCPTARIYFIMILSNDGFDIPLILLLLNLSHSCVHVYLYYTSIENIILFIIIIIIISLHYNISPRLKKSLINNILNYII